jgi:hypothetical protein
MMSVGVKEGNARVQLTAAGAVTGDPIRVSSVTASSTINSADTATGYTAGQWCHAAGVFASSTSRIAYINGGNSGSNATPTASSSWDTLLLGGRYVTSAIGFWFDGNIAEAAVWNVALTADEIAQLASGHCPLFVRPQALVHYVPGFGRAGASGGEEDWVGGLTLTQVNSPTVADHPRIIYPSCRRILMPSAATTTYTLTSATYVPGSLTSSSVTPRIVRTKS